MDKNELSPIQTAVASVIEHWKERSLVTEANIAKAVRELNRVDGKNKAGIGLMDLEKAVQWAGENALASFGVHLNSANDLLLRKADPWRLLDSDSRKRRISSEKAMDILTSGDLGASRKKLKKPKDNMRTSRKSLNIFGDVEDWEE